MLLAAPRVAIDLSFGALMSPREHRSLGAQLLRVYGGNRKHSAPLDLHICGLDGAPAACLPPPDHLQAWEAGGDVTLHCAPAAEVWQPEQTVWLSPDAELALDAPLLRGGEMARGAGSALGACDDDSGETLARQLPTFVLGGLIDRSVKKGHTLQRALASGAAARRLPIREFAPRSDLHPILTLTACVQVLCEVNGGAAWADAFSRAIPRSSIRRREWEEQQREEARRGAG